MRMVLACIAATASVAGLVAPLSAGALRDVEGRRRVLVVVAPDALSPALVAQDRLLEGDRAGIHDRDIVIVRVVGARVEGADDDAAALRRRLGVAADGFAVRLIGKDGHVALRDDRPLPPARLFAAIDAMPMRRAEVARRGR